MGSHKNSIEINGKLYDATTGKLAVQKNSSLKNKKETAPKKSGAVVDGFFRRVPSSTKPPAIKPAETKQSLSSTPKTPPVKYRPKAAQTERHKPQKSHTLMRGAVKKPTLKSTATTPPSINKKTSVIDASRLQRAKQIPKSSFVKRFPSFSTHSAFVKKVTSIDVRPAPAHPNQIHNPSTPIANHTPAAATAPQSNAEKLFSRAIEEAPLQPTKPHKSKKRSPRSRKIVSFGAGVSALVLLAGFIVYQNMPNLSMRVAATRAGFAANMPGYTPAGFSNRGSIQASPGEVRISFHSNSDERNYRVTQKVSNWNSQALLENFVTANGKTYQTLQDKGKIIYMYDGSNATWVNGGVWYQIEGDSSLNNDQLLRIIESI